MTKIQFTDGTSKHYDNVVVGLSGWVKAYNDSHGDRYGYANYPAHRIKRISGRVDYEDTR